MRANVVKVVARVRVGGGRVPVPAALSSSQPLPSSLRHINHDDDNPLQKYFGLG